MLEKNKRGIRLGPAFMAFQLIAPLPLEECIYRIRFGFQMELLSIEVKQLDADRVNFQIKKQFGERVLQGTLYYINAETTGIKANAPIPLRILPNLFAPLGILLFLMLTPLGFNGMISAALCLLPIILSLNLMVMLIEPLVNFRIYRRRLENLLNAVEPGKRNDALYN